MLPSPHGYILVSTRLHSSIIVALYNWLVVIHISQIQPGSCIGQSKHVGRSWSLYTILKFRCGNWWDICTTAFDLHRNASNTGILSLFRHVIKHNCRYSSFVFLGASSTLTWPLIWSLILEVPFSLCNFPPDRTLLSIPHNLSCGFLCHIFLIAAAHAPCADLEVDG